MVKLGIFVGGGNFLCLTNSLKNITLSLLEKLQILVNQILYTFFLFFLIFFCSVICTLFIVVFVFVVTGCAFLTFVSRSCALQAVRKMNQSQIFEVNFCPFLFLYILFFC